MVLARGIRAAAVAFGVLLAFAGVAQAAPVVAFNSFVEQVGVQYQHAIGPTLYVNTMQSGTAEVRIDASDAGGITSVGFPALGTGWTPGAGTDTTGPSPYTYTYSWSAGAVSPGQQVATATATGGGTATANFTINADTAQPTGGAISYPNGPTNAVSIAVVHSSPVDAGSGMATVQLQRRQAPYVAGSCGAWGAWANVGAPNPPSPYTDTTIVDATCYEYRLSATDNVGNAVAVAAPSTVKVDRTAPVGSIDATPVSPFSGTKAITGTSNDTASGVAGVTLSYSGPASGTICTNPASLKPFSCPWNTTTLPDGTYTLQLVVTDAAGNVGSPITRAVIVDNGPPLATFDAFVEQTNPANQFANGSTMFINPAVSGSFEVRVNATDAGTGIDRVEFPTLGTNWTPGGSSDSAAPYAVTYSWAAGAASPGAKSATAYDVAGGSSSASFTVTADATAPTGGSISYPASASSSATVTFAVGTDARSGVASWQLQRASSSLAGDMCGAFGTWANVGAASPAPTTWADTTIAAGTCYRYRLLVTDNVGNVATSSSATELKVSDADTTPPAGGSISAALNTGSIAITFASGSDAGSGIAESSVQRRSAPLVEGVCGTFGAWTALGGASSSPATDANVAEGACYEYRLLVRDNASNTATFGPTATIQVPVHQVTGQTGGDGGGTTGTGTTGTTGTTGGTGTTGTTGTTGGGTTVTGTSGGEQLGGTSGTETINAGEGRDTIVASGGDDVIDGGPGIDTIVLSPCASTKVDLARGTITGCGGTTSIRNVENVVGSPGADVITGGRAANRINGGGGADVLEGGGGDDQLNGGAGVDRIGGGGGRDHIIGGNGNDRLVGGAGNDRIIGGEGDDTIFAGEGDDDVLAGNGNDTARGDGGNDHLAGANGDDVLVGGAGRDRLEGGPGRDRLDGGLGIDLLDGLRD